jgi:hypothetical protein
VSLSLYRYYTGQLVCEHMCGVYLAYAIITNSGGVVRIFNRMSDERVLIKVKGQQNEI